MKLSLSAHLAIMAGMLLIDQGSKIWVRAEIPLSRMMPFIPNLIDLTHVENPGVSFSILGGLNDSLRVPLLVTISVVAVGLLTFYWLRHRGDMNRLADLGFVLILPGAVGNLIDRALFGTVTDFLRFRFYSYSFFVNNFADILISAGVGAYLIGVLIANRGGPDHRE